MVNNNKIKVFTDLRIWQEAHRLVLEIYQMSKLFPDSEKFSLTMQLKRAAVSITSNIAEGFSRISYKEKIRFYAMALGSTTEIQNQLIICKDLKYVKLSIFNELMLKSIDVHKLINSLIKSSKNIILNS